MNGSGRMVALALAVVPLGAALAGGQQPRTPARSPVTETCVNGKCIEDSSRVIVLQLMDRVDSLRRIYLDKPIAPEERARMSEQMADMIRQLTDRSMSAAALGLQEANEATRAAMVVGADAAQRMAMASVEQRIPAAAAPKGWIGLTFVGVPVTDVRDGEYFIRFLDYPEVETVEPSSPAQRAGIMHGDLLLAFNGQDVTSRAISMTRLLQPDRKITVRMERDGQPHEYSLMVAKAPQSYALRIDDFSAPRAPGVTVNAVAAPPTMPVQGAFYAPTPAPPSAVVAGVPLRASAFNFSRSDDMAGIAGASMTTLNPDFARNLHLGADHGVLVIDAPAGTPASEAGLHNGDIVVQVEGEDVASVRDLRRALERRASQTTIGLQIVRNKQKQTIKIKND